MSGKKLQEKPKPVRSGQPDTTLLFFSDMISIDSNTCRGNHAMICPTVLSSCHTTVIPLLFRPYDTAPKSDARTLYTNSTQYKDRKIKVQTTVVSVLDPSKTKLSKKNKNILFKGYIANGLKILQVAEYRKLYGSQRGTFPFLPLAYSLHCSTGTSGGSHPDTALYLEYFRQHTHHMKKPAMA